MTHPSPPASGATFFGHPRGLSTLFFTEMWERFSYYGMRAILILFMTAGVTEGGLGMGVATAGAIYGLYTSGVYMLSLPGGWVADRILGQRRAVLFGGILIALGQFLLAASIPVFFYLGLVVIVLGTGLLKPNISTMVGQLYTQGDARRDAGFSIFYMGINLGAFIAPLIVGWVGQRVDWHLAFALAGVGMTIGVVQYWFGGRHLGDAGLHPVAAGAEQAASQKRLFRNGVVGILALIGAVTLLASAGVVSPVGISNAFGVILLLVAVTLFGWLIFGGDWTPVERKRIVVIFALFLAASLFWSAFEQAGSTLNLFAQRSTRTEILGFNYPASWMQSVNAMFIIAFAPVFAWIWMALSRRGAEPSSPTKFALGLISLGAGFAVLAWGALLASSGGQVSPLWLVVTYLLHTTGELCLSPVGLSAMTKLAPVRVAGMMMGVWFLSNAVGNYLGGRLAAFYESFPLPMLFGIIAAFGVGAGLIMALLVPTIKKLMGGVK